MPCLWLQSPEVCVRIFTPASRCRRCYPQAVRQLVTQQHAMFTAPSGFAKHSDVPRPCPSSSESCCLTVLDGLFRKIYAWVAEADHVPDPAGPSPGSRAPTAIDKLQHRGSQQLRQLPREESCLRAAAPRKKEYKPGPGCFRVFFVLKLCAFDAVWTEESLGLL